MTFDFASLIASRHRPIEVEQVELPAEVIGTRLSDDAVIELWEERSAIQESDNLELVGWCISQGFPPKKTRRYCELCAAADLSLTYGTYVESIIWSLITPENV